MKGLKKEIIIAISIVFIMLILSILQIVTGYETTNLIKGEQNHYNSSALPVLESGKVYTITPPDGTTVSTSGTSASVWYSSPSGIMTYQYRDWILPGYSYTCTSSFSYTVSSR